MSSLSSTKTSIINDLSRQFKSVKFKPANDFYWSPKEKIVYYNQSKMDNEKAKWTLLHEISHAKLKHTDYKSDLELLLCEVTAWEEAVKLAGKLNLKIDTDHVESCLDTYRDWLYARSKCPTCQLNGLQKNTRQYQCLNCLAKWQVSPSRFCRPYRMTQIKKPS